jgi:hypothetical protein
LETVLTSLSPEWKTSVFDRAPRSTMKPFFAFSFVGHSSAAAEAVPRPNAAVARKSRIFIKERR